jgi:hypothetical protein
MKRKKEKQYKRHSPSLKNLKKRGRNLIKKEFFIHLPYTPTCTSWSGCMTCYSQGSCVWLDNTWGIGMPHVFPTYNPTYQLIRSRWRKKVNQCLGEESYTLSDPRVSFEELWFLCENLQNLQIDDWSRYSWLVNPIQLFYLSTAQGKWSYKPHSYQV